MEPSFPRIDSARKGGPATLTATLMKYSILSLIMALPSMAASPSDASAAPVPALASDLALHAGEDSSMETSYGRGYRPYYPSYPYPQRRYRRCY